MNHDCHRRSLDQRGVTLLEVMIASALFAVGMMGLASMTCGLLAANSNTRLQTEAAVLARNKLEEICGRAYEEVADSSEADIDASGTPGSGRYKRDVIVELESGPVLKEVTVTVSWRAERVHRVRLKTLVAP